MPPPPTAAAPGLSGAPAHGLCEVTLPPVDAKCAVVGSAFPCLHGAVWRGMTHHSQFRCVVLNAEASNTEPRLAPLDVYGGQHRFSQCHVACPAGDPTCAADCAGGA